MEDKEKKVEVWQIKKILEFVEQQKDGTWNVQIILSSIMGYIEGITGVDYDSKNN